MISQIDEALKETVRTALAGADVDVVLDAPTKDWAARRNAPTISLYLYDLREDPRRRSQGMIERRAPDGTVVGRLSPPRMFRLSYLVTAWTQRPEDEHRLLDTVLTALLGCAVLPGWTPPPALAESGITVPLLVAMPPPEDRGLTDVWSALGGELKPSLDVVLIAPADPVVDTAIAAPVQEGMLLDVDNRAGGAGDAGRQLHVPPTPIREGVTSVGEGVTSVGEGVTSVGEGVTSVGEGVTSTTTTPKARARTRRKPSS